MIKHDKGTACIRSWLYAGMSQLQASYSVDLSSGRLALVQLRHTMAMRACEAFSPMFNKGLETLRA